MSTINVKLICSIAIVFFIGFNSSAQNYNGLTKTGNNFELGGTLTKDTKVDLGASFWFKLSKSAQDYITVLNGGNVGINTSNPAYTLDVNGAVRIGSLSSDPTGAAGVIYYNTTLNKLKAYVNGGWKNVLMDGDVSGSSLPANQIAYGTGSGITGSSNLTYDGNNTLGFGNGHSIASQSGVFVFNTNSGGIFSFRVNGGLALNVGANTTVYGDLNTYSATNGQSVQLKAGNTDPDTWASGRLQLGYSENGNYGWLQSLNNGSNLHLQKTGGKVLIANISDQGDYKLQVGGPIFVDGGTPTMNRIYGKYGSGNIALLVSDGINANFKVGFSPGNVNIGGNTDHIIRLGGTDAQSANFTPWLTANGGGVNITSLKTSNASAPNTTGVTKMVITDQNGLLSYQDIPASGGGDFIQSQVSTQQTSLGFNISGSGYFGYDVNSQLGGTIIAPGNIRVWAPNDNPGSYSTIGLYSATNPGYALPNASLRYEPATGKGSLFGFSNWQSAWSTPISFTSHFTGREMLTLQSQYGGVTLENLTSDGTSQPGTMYYNSSTNKFRGYQDGAWKNFLMEGDAGGGSYIASNGLTLNGNTMGLGGTLEQFTKIYFNNNPLMFLVGDEGAMFSKGVSTQISKNGVMLRLNDGGTGDYTPTMLTVTDLRTSNNQEPLSGTVADGFYTGVKGVMYAEGGRNNNSRVGGHFAALAQGTGDYTGYGHSYFGVVGKAEYSFNGISSDRPTQTYGGYFESINLSPSTEKNYGLYTKATGNNPFSIYADGGNVYIKDIPNAINNTNKFLVSDGGVLKYRTTSEMLSDLGVSGGGSVSLPSNQVAFGTGSNISGSNNLTYNGSTLTINASSIDVSKYADYKLAVNGNAIFTRVKVKESAQWPDYVFERNYQLPSLKEVEAFIKQHKHLPEVPSAEEVKKDGLDIGDNQAMLLKKIEELTLYAIEQNKKQEEQNKRIEQLEKELELLKKK